MKKLLLITPKFAPEIDGLSDHGFCLYSELKSYFDVKVLTSQSSNRLKDSNIHYYIKDWKFNSLVNAFEDKEIDSDILLIQYVPFMYAKRAGINFSFILFCLYLRFFKNKTIVSYCHELHYPFHMNLKALLMAFSHWVMLIGLTLSSNRILVSCERFKRELNRLTFFSSSKIDVVPVGSNINAAVANKLKGQKYRIGMFGSFHPSKHVPEILNGCLDKVNSDDIEFVYIGKTTEELNEILSSVNKGRVLGFGQLSEEEVASELNNIDLALCYFETGATCRRGTLFAFMKYGVPIVTNFSELSDKTLENVEGLFLTGDSTENFIEEFEKIISNREKYSNYSLSVQNAYEKLFSWSVGVKKIVNAINS